MSMRPTPRCQPPTELLLLLPVLLVASAGSVEAQLPVSRTLLHTESGCERFVLRDGARANDLDTLTKCIVAGRDVAKELADTVEAGTAVKSRLVALASRAITSTTAPTGDAELSPTELRAFVIARHSVYRELRDALSQVRRVASDTASVDSAAVELARLQAHLHRALHALGLEETFSAVLLASGALEDVNPSASVAVHPSTESPSVEPVVTLVWQSRHVTSEGTDGLDFGISGWLGFLPVPRLVAPESEPDPSDSVPAPAAPAAVNETADTMLAELIGGFAWAIDARANYAFVSNGELSVAARAGMTRVSNGATVHSRSGRTRVYVPFANDVGTTAWFYEIGFEANVFKDALEVVHVDRGVLSPVFHAAAGMRWDGRYEVTPDAGATADPRAVDAEKRWYARFMFDALRVTDRRDADTSRTFTLGFGVEWEGARGTSQMPSRSRFILRGDLDFLRAVN